MVEICGYLTMFFLVSTSVVFVLISVALTEFCAEFEYFSQDLTEMLLILRRIRLLSSPYLQVRCITVSRDQEQPAAPARADKRSAPCSLNEWRGFVPLSVRLSDVALVNHGKSAAIMKICKLLRKF